jgi:hypothetical protein
MNIDDSPRRCPWPKRRRATRITMRMGCSARRPRLFESSPRGSAGRLVGRPFSTRRCRRCRLADSSAKVARFDRRRIEALMRDTGIVRNRLKIERP